MIASRSLDDLLPPVKTKAEAFLAACEAAGAPCLITSTYRDAESQAAIWAQGRTEPGHIVTNAMPGQSFHQYRVAFDFVPIINGKPQWEDIATFTKCGEIAESCGLIWAGRWLKFKELCHCQDSGGLSLADLQAGKVPST